MMKSTHATPHKKLTRVAVPYYGSFMHPQTGMATIYFFAEVDLEQRQIHRLSLEVWNAEQEPDLGQWLQRHQVNGLICRDHQCPYFPQLQRKGFWVTSVPAGDAEEMLENWLQENTLAARCECTA